MDFPKRVKQHKSQSDSFAILLYKLKDLGIFRGSSENDYGIDFEIELVHNDRVVGRYLKAQVKSAEDIIVRKDGVPTVGGIKQSTLLYWTELSFRTHVIVFAVDLTTEKIYYTDTIFWQATALLDKSESTKTIEFNKPLLSSEIKKGLGKEVSEKTADGFENYANTQLIKRIGFQHSITDIIYAHKTMLRNLEKVLELYSDLWHYDYHCEVFLIDILKTVLECARILIMLPENISGIDESEKKYIFSFSYWVQKSDLGEDEIANYIAQKPIKIIIPQLLDELKHYSDLVLKAKEYWKFKDVPYLKMVYEIVIPTVRTHEDIQMLDYARFTQENRKNSFNNFFYEE